MAKIIDLDKIASEDITVIVQAQKYKLPADIPVPDYLDLVRLGRLFDEAGDGESGDDASDVISQLYEKMLQIFRYRQPELDALPVSATQLVSLLIRLYSDIDDTDDAAEVSSSVNPSVGTKNTKKPKPKK